MSDEEQTRYSEFYHHFLESTKVNELRSLKDVLADVKAELLSRDHRDLPLIRMYDQLEVRIDSKIQSLESRSVDASRSQLNLKQLMQERMNRQQNQSRLFTQQIQQKQRVQPPTLRPLSNEIPFRANPRPNPRPQHPRPLNSSSTGASSPFSSVTSNGPTPTMSYNPAPDISLEQNSLQQAANIQRVSASAASSSSSQQPKRKKIKTVQAKKEEKEKEKKKEENKGKGKGKQITKREQSFLRSKRLEKFADEAPPVSEPPSSRLKPVTEEEQLRKRLNLEDPRQPSVMEDIPTEIYDLCIPNRGTVELREHQERVVRHMFKNRGLIAVHSVGSGKTLIAATCAICIQVMEPNIKIVFVGPKSLLTNFSNELKRSYGEDVDLTNFKLYTYEKFHMDYLKGLIDCNNTFLIVDEAHRLRTRTETGAGDKKVSVAPKTVTALLKCARKAKKVLLLTATPCVNKPYDIVNLISMIDGETNPMFEKAFNAIVDKNSGNVKDRRKFEEYFKCKVSFYLRPHSADYPTSTVTLVDIEMPQKYYEEYNRVEKQDLSNIQYEVLGTSDLEPFYNGIRRTVHADVEEYNPKLDWVKSLLIQRKNEQLRDGVVRKMIIFSPFISLGVKQLEGLVKDFDVPPKFGEITGQDTKKNRQSIIDKYNNNEIQIILISIGAGGLGINLKGTRDVIIMQPGWNDVEMQQAIGRAIRYQSHSHLPENQRHVDVWKLMLNKPRGASENAAEMHRKMFGDKNTNPADLYRSTMTNKLQTGKSADYIIEDIAQRKTRKIDRFIANLMQISIENDSQCHK